MPGEPLGAAAAEMPARRMPAAQIALDAARHLLPLVPLYVFNGSVVGYLVLTAFDLSLGLMLIVGTTRDRNDPTSVDPRSLRRAARLAAVLVLAIFLALVASVVAIPLSAPAVIFGLATGADWRALLLQQGFWIPAACMALLAASRAQFAFEATTVAGARGSPARTAPVIGDLQQDRKRSRAAYAAQVTLIATFVALSYALLAFGRGGYRALPIVYAVLLVFHDARPDLAQRIFPAMWR
jgi:hypothetical protein